MVTFLLLAPLLYKDVIEVRKETRATNHSPLLVLTSDLEEYFSKTPKDQTPELNIICEFLCSYLLQCWDIKTPEIAALKVDSGIIKIPLSPNHKRNYFSRHSFGSKILDPVVVLDAIMSIDTKHDYNKFENPVDILKIGLFDIWIENDDRKPTNTNILVKNDGNGFNFYAIDHSFTFSSMKFIDLNPVKDLGVSYNDSILYSDFTQSVYNLLIRNRKKLLDELKDYFIDSVTNCQNNFNYITNNIPKDLGLSAQDISAIKKFLFSKARNKRVFTEFCRRF